MSGQCLPSVENVFGPRVRDCGTDFDFTLLFEETILFVTPLALVSLWAFVRIFNLHGCGLIVRKSALFFAKIATYCVTVTVQVIQLIILLATAAPRSRTTIATIVIGIVGFILLAWLSALEHLRSPRPSTLLVVYLLATFPMDIVRTRTLFEMEGGTGSGAVFVTVLGLKVVALGLELQNKRSLLLSDVPLFSPEQTSGIVNRAFLWWLRPLFVTGFRNSLTTKDLMLIDDKLSHDRLRSSSSSNNIVPASQVNLMSTEHRSCQLSGKRYALLSLVIRRHGRLLLDPVFPRLCFLALTFTQPFLVDRASTYISEDLGANTYKVGGGLIAAYLLVYVGIGVTFAFYQQKANFAATSIRAALVSEISQQTLNVNLSCAAKMSSTTLISAHVESIQLGFRRLHEIWANLLGVAIGHWLLYNKLGLPMLAALGLSLACVALGFLLSTLAGPYQKVWFDQIERRVSKTAQAINSIKSIKMTGGVSATHSNITDARIKDIKMSQNFRMFTILIITLSYASVAVSPALGLGIHGVIRSRSPGLLLEPATAFSALTLFTLISMALAQSIDAIMGFVTMINCLGRIQEFLTSETRVDPRERMTTTPLTIHSGEAPSFVKDDSITYEKQHNPMLMMENYCMKWNADEPWVLSNINFRVKPCELVMIIGPTGCGKSTLLKAILGEAGIVSGRLMVNDSRIGFCDQHAWVHTGTIRDNIIGVNGFDEARYRKTLQVCALEQDLSDLPSGDGTLCGSNGFGLSGGQKSRIALARVVYAAPPIVVLDDSLSGLDAETESHVFKALFGTQRIFDDWSVTTILTTSSPSFLPQADRIIVLDGNGTITNQGSYEEVMNDQLLSNYTIRSVADGDVAQQKYSAPSNALTNTNEKGSPETAELRRPAREFAVYKYYIGIIGPASWALFLTLCAVFVFGIIYPQIYLKSWTEFSPSRQRETLPILLGIYFGVGITSLFAFAGACTYFMLRMGPRASFKFHQVLLDTVLNAPMSFFYETNNGLTINRFGIDLRMIDRELPFALVGTAIAAVSAVGQYAVVIVGSHYAGIAIPGILIATVLVQISYLRTSRQLRILDLEAKAPLLSHFLDSVKGLDTIRALGWTNEYVERGLTAMKHAQQPFYLFYSGQILLELVLDLINACLAVIIMSIAVGAKSTSSAGLGLALFSVVTLGQSTKALIQAWTNLEIALGAVSRVRTFALDTESENNEGVVPSHKWPSAGDLQFRDITVAYSSTLEPVLRDLTLHVKAGTKFGICGRSGSGKSTLIAALLRFVDLRDGNIALDGVDLASVSRTALRSRLNVLPQEPFTLHASIRDNLNFDSFHSDSEIIECLQRVKLWEAIEDKGGLEVFLTHETLSHGQLQLFCFARAILKKGEILVLDEPSSSVDANIQKIMQEILLYDFRDSTVVCIAHRLDTIVDFDEVAVMQSGRIAEIGNPRVLLQNPRSAFAQLYDDYQGRYGKA